MGWASKSRKQIIESDEESIQDESVTRCICGEQHNIGLMVQCDQCEVWQHCECMKLKEEDIPEQYFCEQCRPMNHLIESYKPLSPEPDIEIIHDSDIASSHEIESSTGRLSRTKRIDKKLKIKKRRNKTPPSMAFSNQNARQTSARLPNARMTLQEMNRRANQIRQQIYSMQLEMRRCEMEQSAGTAYPPPHLMPGSPSSMSSASTIPLDEPIHHVKTEPSCFELMDLLTRDLNLFQQRFGHVGTESIF